MATATAEPKMVAVPSTGIVFLSRRSDLTLIMERDRPVYDRGERVGVEEGKRIAFRDGRLTVPRDKGFVTGTRGERIPAADVLRFLEGDEDSPPHAALNNREEGFWRHIEPPPAPSEDESTQIIVLAEEGDVDGLQAFIEQERAGWHRDELISIAQGSLDRVRARQTKPEPKPAPKAQE